MERRQITSVLERMGERKLLSFSLILFTLAIGVVLGTMISSDVGAARDEEAARDAKPLTIPDPVPLENEFGRIAQQVAPAVVNIQVEVTQRLTQDREGDRSEDFFRRFFGLPEGPFRDLPRDFRRPGEGSGVIVDENGYVITNHHVVDGADRIKVYLSTNGKSIENQWYDAKLIGADPETDLAVIKIETEKKLPTAKIGNSDAVQVGDWAIAVGSPFGYEETVTVGIISAKGREVRPTASRPRQFQKFLQTDAAINPGNSGGPLMNIRGEVIGINTAIVSRSGGYEGLGFALASNIAVEVYNQIIKHGRVTRGSIGIEFREEDPALLRTYGAKDGGVFVYRVKENGPADRAGMQPEDVIIEIDGKPIRNGEELVQTVASTPVGETVPIVVVRDGERQTLNVKIADRAELFGEELGLSSGERDEEAQETQVMFGISVSNLTSSQRDQLELESPEGVLVTEVEPASFADDIGIMANDVIVAINRQSVSNIDDIRQIQNDLKPGDDVAFKLLRRLPGSRSWSTVYAAGVLRSPEGERF